MNTGLGLIDRKSTRLNSSHLVISYAVFCLKKKKEAVIRHVFERDQRAARDQGRGPANGPEQGGIMGFHGAPLAAPDCCWFFFLRIGRPPKFPLFPSTTLSG